MSNLTIKGDLCQISTQSLCLTRNGFELERSDVYRILKSEDVKEALVLIFNNSIEGWWHYETEFIELGICTKEEFWKKLRGYNENS